MKEVAADPPRVSPFTPSRPRLLSFGEMGKSSTSRARIEIGEAGVRVRDLEIRRRSVAEYLRELAPEDREAAFVHAVEVGVFCLERAGGARDLDFVRRQVDQLLLRVTEAVSAIPEAVQAGLIEKLGTDDGQVLAPVQRSIDHVSSALGERIREVQGLLSEKIDPDKRSSVLGRALARISDLLDPARADSVQAVVAKAVEDVSRRDGALARSVRATVEEAIRPLADEVDRLAKQIAAGEAAREALEGTTAKGASFEERVVVELQRQAEASGAAVHHVGEDSRPGDILLEFPPDGLVQPALRIVVEVRDRATRAGRKAIADAMERAMIERSAEAGIYLTRSSDGLGREIGEWGEGACERGPWVATTVDYLPIAIRLLVVLARLATVRHSEAAIDRETVRGQLGRIRTSLKRIAHINRAATEIRARAGTVEEEAECLRREVRDALTSLEEAARLTSLEESVA